MKVINVVLLKLGVTVDYKNQFVFVRVYIQIGITCEL